MTGEALTLPFETPPDPEATLVAHGPAARDRLWTIIGELQATDRLAPVTVAVPSPYAGLSLRRDLGATSGLLNVRFMALARIAELLGAPSLAAAGRRPLTAPLRVEAVAAALAEDPGPFEAVSDHPSTARGVAGSIADLRTAGVSPSLAAAVLTERGPRAAAVARLYGAVTERAAAFYDEDDVLRAAADVVLAREPDDLGHVVVWLPTRLSAAEAAFVGALSTVGRLTVLVGRTGDPEVDDALASPIATRLGAEVATDPLPDAPIGTAMLAAPDPEDEVRAVVRRVVERAHAGTPLHEMAILYRLEEPYARLAPELLDAAGVTWNGPSPRRLSDAALARVLLGALALADSDLARDELAAWLASGPILDPADGRRVPAARWDVVSREAGVVGGAGQWAERLRRHRELLFEQLVTARADDDAPAWRVARLEGDLATVDALAAFVADLGERVAPPVTSTWAAHVTWARDLVERYVGGEGKRAGWPDAELDAARRVVATLEELAGLDELGAAVEVPRFRRAVADALDTTFGRVEQYGRGVFVGSVHHAYGARFSVVFVLGMAEGGFPPRGGEDPLLPDAERRLLAEELPSHAERKLAERRDYLAALSAAPERVLCFPRADPRAQRRRLPARLLLDTARRLHGTDLTAEQLRDLEAAPWLEVVSSFDEGITADAAPASVTERDVRALDEWVHASLALPDHPLVTGPLGAGVDAIVSRASRDLTAHDGNVGAQPGLAADASRPVSPTSLQEWATCPFRYLLGHVLRVREVPKPETTESISALDEGTLVHAILERFVSEARPRTAPDERWDADDRRLLSRIVDEECAGAEQRGVTGRSLHWQLAQRRIRRTADRFLVTDEHARATRGVVADADGLETPFGLDGAVPVTLTLSDGREVAFRGRIDRIDRSPDGSRAVVYDYKTGSAQPIDDDRVEGGTRLQLPVYALAARAHYGTDDVAAYYWYTREEGEAALAGYELDASTSRRFAEVVGHIADGIAGGCYPAHPGDSQWDNRRRRESFSNCRWCVYDRLCAPDRRAAWDRKIDDPVLTPYLALDGDEEPAP